ncbi:hypothetical protein CYY_003878 [Polysphondylium violaceum]|uniref:Diaminopimelate epimerase n=1 Tax=Polysphondylium violaceum TaxID=133409 RepID=A0A8J4PZ18_9MYCE|nr:hypothetical protein CYY_003878 [Polysphondylium violaceum]
MDQNQSTTSNINFRLINSNLNNNNNNNNSNINNNNNNNNINNNNNNDLNINNTTTNSQNNSSNSNNNITQHPLLIKFCKMHGCCNDFVIFHIDNVRFENDNRIYHPSIPLLQSIAQNVCHRSTGIGADQLLVLTPPPLNIDADYQMLIFNADGSVAENCANGVTCISKFIIDYQIPLYRNNSMSNNNSSSNINNSNNTNINNPPVDNNNFPVNNNPELKPFFIKQQHQSPNQPHHSQQQPIKSINSLLDSPYSTFQPTQFKILTIAGIQHCLTLPQHQQNNAKTLWSKVDMGNPLVFSIYDTINTQQYHQQENETLAAIAAATQATTPTPTSSSVSSNSFSQSPSQSDTPSSIMSLSPPTISSIPTIPTSSRLNLNNNNSNSNMDNSNSNNNNNTTIDQFQHFPIFKLNQAAGTMDRMASSRVLTTESSIEDYSKTIQFGTHFINSTLVSLGNPHCVLHLENVEEFPLEHYGKVIESHPIFPQKTNVEFVEVKSMDLVRVRVWQRGCGITSSCGTGAAAALVSGVLRGVNSRRALIEMDGGILEAEWREDNNQIFISGPATTVFEGTIRLYFDELENDDNSSFTSSGSGGSSGGGSSFGFSSGGGSGSSGNGWSCCMRNRHNSHTSSVF